MRRSALVALGYAAVAGVYIWASDHVVARLATDTSSMRVISTLKGLGFVAVTTIGLFVLLWRLGVQVQRRMSAETVSSMREEQWKVLFEHAPDAAFLLDGDRFIEASVSAGALFGCRPEALVGRTPWDVSPRQQPGGASSHEEAAWRLASLKVGKVSRFPWVHSRADGSQFEASVALAALPNQPHRTLAFVRDVSEARANARELESRGDQMRLLVEGTRNFFFYVQGLDSNVTYVSPSVEQITGRPAGEWLGQHHWWVTSNPLNAEAIAATRRHLQGELDNEPIFVEVQHSDGHPVMLEVHEFGRWKDGKLIGLQGIAHDVTRRKQAEEALQRSEGHFRQMEKKYRTIFENAGEGIYQATTEGEFVTVNPTMAHILGYESAEQLLAETTERGAHFYAEPARWQQLTELLKGRGSVTAFESRMVRRDGTVILVSENVRALRDGHGEPLAYEGVLVDVTERRRSEEALRESEETARALLNAPDDAAALLDPDGVVLAANETAGEVLGVRVSDLLGMCLFDLFSPEQAAAAGKSLAKVVRSGEKLRFVQEWKGRSFTITIYPVLDAKLSVSRLAIFARDISDQIGGERARNRLATAVEQAAEAIMITDVDGVIEYVNPAFEDVTGYSQAEALGTNPRMLKSGQHDEAFYAHLWRTIRAGDVWAGHLVNRRKDGTLYEEEATISPVRDREQRIVNFVAVKRDVTEQTALQAQLRQSQKMEAVGQLAGGVAHDFNNLLQALVSTLELLRAQGDDRERREAAISEVEAYVKRGSSLTRQLLLFSRRGVTRRERLELNEVLRETSSLLQRLVRENIHVDVELEPASLPVEADRGQLEQVLVNLVVNASDAMPGGGRMVLRTGRRPEGHVCFEVEDTGRGIAEELREKVFEPFFTTKAAEKGTGLGLSVVHGIVTGHGGWVELVSEIDRGTLFRVVLPRAADLPEGARSGAECGAAASGPPPGSGERVLLVEDEDGARHGLAEMLSMLGYEVTEVASGEDALALRTGHGYDVLLSDLLLPGLHGFEVARRLRERWPDLRVILMSGYAEDEATRQGLSKEEAHFLQKPFNLDVLAREIRSALSDPGEDRKRRLD
jgi:two-component system cell cycle sensor histidine kinase/response regulator CckA